MLFYAYFSEKVLDCPDSEVSDTEGDSSFCSPGGGLQTLLFFTANILKQFDSQVNDSVLHFNVIPLYMNFIVQTFHLKPILIMAHLINT